MMILNIFHPNHSQTLVFTAPLLSLTLLCKLRVAQCFEIWAYL